MNPFASTPFAKDTGDKISKKVLPVEDTEKLLQVALDSRRKAADASPLRPESVGA